jgi:hypothetical protein
VPFCPAALPLSTATPARVSALIRTRRHRLDRPFYSGKHRHHGMNLQAVAAPIGELPWVSGAMRGSIHDTAAVRIRLLPGCIQESGLFALGDKGYRGLDDETAVTPFWNRGKPAWQQERNRLHARLRGPGERAFAQFKGWGCFRPRPLRPTPDHSDRQDRLRAHRIRPAITMKEVQ